VDVNLYTVLIVLIVLIVLLIVALSIWIVRSL
jgi:hypothetical protein